jgi:hypothetical protein
MEGQFVVKRVTESGTYTEYFRHDNDGDWIWRSSIESASTFEYWVGKLVASLLLAADKRVSMIDLPIYSIVRVDRYEEFIR